MIGSPKLFGLLAEFLDGDDLVAAAARATAAGYRDVEAYAPLPVKGLAEALRFRRTWMPEVVLAGGLVGAISGLALQYYVCVIAYPLDIGGRPLFSWPSFIPVIFEMTVLFAAIAAVLGMLALNGLPRPHHPLFAIPRFDHVTRDGFFLCIAATDPKFERQSTRQFLEQLPAKEVIDVPI